MGEERKDSVEWRECGMRRDNGKRKLVLLNWLKKMEKRKEKRERENKEKGKGKRGYKIYAKRKWKSGAASRQQSREYKLQPIASSLKCSSAFEHSAPTLLSLLLLCRSCSLCLLLKRHIHSRYLRVSVEEKLRLLHSIYIYLRLGFGMAERGCWVQPFPFLRVPLAIRR
ncbi:hypothetical protein VNO77_10735 [Canavalia gladiata]|uniref:Uncharacterized protein n=1 Tax=Canavalia gladiata TaxID=3824 RepID=A0AAN9MH93_CANGL